MDVSALISNLWSPNRNPVTIFCYPRTIADEHKLPCDAEAIRYLIALMNAGVRVGVWGHEAFPNEYYFVCPFEDFKRCCDATEELENRRVFPKGFNPGRCEYLFSVVPAAY